MSDRPKLDALEARLAGIRARQKAGFVDRARELRQAAEALDAGDEGARETIRRLAHRLRGVAGNAGRTGLGERAGRLEEAAKTDAAALAIAEGARRLAQAAEAASGSDEDARPPATDAGDEAPAPAARRLGWRVVALDDEASTRRLLSLTLGSAGGCEAVVLADPAEAMRAIRERPPDLVIVDAMMPEVDGLAFYRGVRRATDATLPVVILSAATPDELGWELPVDPRLEWMRKPFRPRALLDELRAFVEG
ncbi:MAG TPA: response regulator [Sandaracinaceae bacterium LLY-WYZ-13_1]|nr:response regulator [Sandaracinaceae bacterium LLY-WYZ-13_1]